MNEVRTSLRALKEKAIALQELEVDDPSAAIGSDLSADLKLALAAAKASDDVYGPKSEQSHWKWRNVEDVAVGRLEINCIDGEIAEHHGEPNVRYLKKALENHHHDYSIVVDPESLREAIDAMGTIEHLDRLVRIEQKRLQQN